MNELKIHFRGLCTNFLRVIPGVPHRVVLVDGAAVRFGLMMLPPTPDSPPQNVPYVLMPHISLLRVPKGGGELKTPLNVPNAIIGGWIYAGVHLQVRNAILDDRLSYSTDYSDKIRSMTEYVHDYQYSPGIVLAGRAACYVDLFAGDVTTEPFGEAIHTVVRIPTDGEPIMRVTPFSAGSETVQPTDLDLTGVTDLEIANLGLDCISESLDYLLHFLTQEGGIPRNLKKPPLGFGPDQPGIDYAKSFEKLIEKGFPDPSRFDWTDLLPVGVGTSLSCSDSRYP